jgi:pimeloyl-ACP methyl ester carboxylesterase
VLLGGLATIPESLCHILIELTRDFPVYYVETREKSGSEINGKVSFDIETMGSDTAKIIGMLGLQSGKYMLMGYSLGATIIADCYRFLGVKPRCMLFMEPTPVFHYPRWSLPVVRYLGLPLYKVLIPLAKWYLRNFRIITGEDAEMAVISFRALDHADPRKLRNVILAIARYTVWDRLGEIDCPVLVVVASKDHLHVQEETDRMVTLIRNCRSVDLETNLRTHSAEMGQVVREYIHSMD